MGLYFIGLVICSVGQKKSSSVVGSGNWRPFMSSSTDPSTVPSTDSCTYKSNIVMIYLTWELG